MPEKLTVIVQRADSEDWGHAIVRCRKTKDVSHIDQLFPLISDAVTWWIHHEPDGQEAWKNAWHDDEQCFSLVDLYEGIHPSLKRVLADHGICDLTIEKVVHDKLYNLDENLFNENKPVYTPED